MKKKVIPPIETEITDSFSNSKNASDSIIDVETDFNTIEDKISIRKDYIKALASIDQNKKPKKHIEFSSISLDRLPLEYCVIDGACANLLSYHEDLKVLRAKKNRAEKNNGIPVNKLLLTINRSLKVSLAKKKIGLNFINLRTSRGSLYHTSLFRISESILMARFNLLFPMNKLKEKNFKTILTLEIDVRKLDSELKSIYNYVKNEMLNPKSKYNMIEYFAMLRGHKNRGRHALIWKRWEDLYRDSGSKGTFFDAVASVTYNDLRYDYCERMFHKIILQLANDNMEVLINKIVKGSEFTTRLSSIIKKLDLTYTEYKSSNHTLDDIMLRALIDDPDTLEALRENKKSFNIFNENYDMYFFVRILIQDEYFRKEFLDLLRYNEGLLSRKSDILIHFESINSVNLSEESQKIYEILRRYNLDMYITNTTSDIVGVYELKGMTKTRNKQMSSPLQEMTDLIELSYEFPEISFGYIEICEKDDSIKIDVIRPPLSKNQSIFNQNNRSGLADLYTLKDPIFIKKFGKDLLKQWNRHFTVNGERLKSDDGKKYQIFPFDDIKRRIFGIKEEKRIFSTEMEELVKKVSIKYRFRKRGIIIDNEKIALSLESCIECLLIWLKDRDKKLIPYSSLKRFLNSRWENALMKNHWYNLKELFKVDTPTCKM